MTGYRRESLLDRPLGLVFEPESLDYLLQKLPLVAESGKLVQTEKDLLKRAGRVRCRWTISGVRDQAGTVVNYILTFSPVVLPLTTEPEFAPARLQPSLEESLEKSRVEALALLAEGIAHDFNNALTVMLGNLSNARLETALQSSVRGHIDKAVEAIHVAKGLAQQILDSTGGRKPKVEVVNLADLLRQTARFATSGGKVRCDMVSPDGVWGVEVNTQQIRQVFQNLVINACQAMPRGGIIQCFVENFVMPEGTSLGLAAGPYVLVRVRDRGCGIPAARLDKIFEAGYTTKEYGTGIGLATCRTIVQRHGGAITVKSQVNVGTEFRVFLPACQIIEAIVQSDEAKGGSPLMVGGAQNEVITGTGRVLVVDDLDSVRDAAERLLTKLGYEAVSASSGQEAVDLYRQRMRSPDPIDAVLLDMTLPGGLSGDEVKSEILKIDRGARVIATSGFFSDDAAETFREDGYVGILPKPYDVGHLSRVMAEVMMK